MDSFKENSGTKSYKEAKEILDKALNISTSSTWSSSNNGGRNNKFWLVDNLISNNYDVIKKINYNYYRYGIDLMVSNKEKGIANIKTAIELFSNIDRYRPNSILKEIFFQSKNNEIYNIFNIDLDVINIEEIKLILNKIAPFYSSKWNKL
jgi:tetratricopeptide (TPR) repeat protein